MFRLQASSVFTGDTGTFNVRGADPGNGIRVFIPDIGMFVAGLATWLLCRSLVQKTPTEDMAQYNTDFENDEQDEERLEMEDEVMFDEDCELEDECEMEEEKLEEGEEEEEEEEEEESTKLKILRRVTGVASKLKEVIGNIITTAGKVVVTILLGLTDLATIYIEMEDEVMFDEDCELEDECEMEEEKLEEGEEEEEEEEEEESTKLKILRRVTGVASKLKEVIGNIITTAGKVVVTILLGLTGIMLPSLTSAVYFFTFLGLCTWWSFCRTFDPLIFSCLCVLMAIFSAGHLIGLYLYQFQFFQEFVPPKDFYARLFGVTPVIQTNCSATWMIISHPNLLWFHYVNPVMLLVLYYTLATLIRLWLQEPIEPVKCDHNSRTREINPFLTVLLQSCRGNTVPKPCISETVFFLFKMDIDEEENLELEEENLELEEEKDQASNEIVLTAEKRRRMWQTAHYATEERKVGNEHCGPAARKVLLVKVNGTPVDYHSINSTLAIEDGPTKLDVYSTPQYKVNRADDTSEKKEEGDYEVDEDNKEEDEPSEDEENPKVHAVVTVFRFIMKQSYICALIAMMAWSITYHSWLTFVLLIWSCTLWMVRNRRKYAMLTSPFMVFYGNLLLSLQYIWSIDVDEIPKVSGILVRKEEPFAELGSKILCALTFWLLLRQHLMERKEKLEDEGNAALSAIRVEKEEKEEEEEEKEIMHVLGNLVKAMFIKYWIYVCGGMFFFVSFEGKIVMYKIIYMMLFLFCVALYQVHYDWWRRILKYFWMSVVVYTMFVLILVYTYQFESSPRVWSNMTGMDEEKLKDLGLEQFGVAELFTRIFIPTSFLLVCILHLHYFHDHFLELTDLKTLAAKQDSTIYRLVHQDGSLVDITMMNMTTSIAKEDVEEKKSQVEIDEKGEGKEPEDSGDKGGSRHCREGDQPSGAETQTEETPDSKNKWHLVIDRLTVLFLRFLEYFHKLQLFVWWLFELHIIKVVSSYIIWVTVKESLNWTEEKKKDMMMSVLYNKSIDPSNWVGLKKSSPLLEYLRNNLLMLAILAFEITIYRHQEYYRLKNNLTAPATKTIFHAITRHHLDDGIVNCAKYFINYFFYKFGLETCFLMAINVIGQRMDFYAMLHAFCLVAVMYRRRRKAIAEIWPKYCCFLACILTFQYFICIGIPPAACKDYPWRFQGSGMDSNVIKWLYFPDFHTSPNSVFLAYDFMLLLCASLQREVFEDENKAAVRILAGDNVEICRDLDAASFSQHNPVPDFIHCRSYLDMLKVAMFSYLFWFVLTIIFITGTTRISIFCMGYLVACFYFLLFGGGLLLKPIKVILHFWDFLIAYNVFVITMKNVLSRRVFMSYYFLHVVADIRASQILASRGAELFQATIVKAVKARIEEENKSMDQLKRQMDRIKTRQQKFKKGKERMLSLAQESGEGATLIQNQEVEDDEVVRSGDYYLFETDSEEEEEEEKKDDEEPTKKSAFQRAIGKFASAILALPKSIIKLPKTILQYVLRAAKFVYQALMTDSKTSLKEQSKETMRFWKRYASKGNKKKDDKEAYIAIECGEQEEEPGTSGEGKKSNGPDNIIKRVFNVVKFTWVLFLTLLDSFTEWLNSISKEHIDISTVLRIERCMLIREIKKGNVPSREDIHIYYQNQMRLNLSRESGLDQLDVDLSTCSHNADRKRGARRMHSLDSAASRDSLSSVYTEATMLFSWQSTVDDLDRPPEHVPKTSERARLKLRKMYSMEMSSSSADSGSIVSSEPTQCTTLFSREGTTDTIEEVEDEEDEGGLTSVLFQTDLGVPLGEGGPGYPDEEPGYKVEVNANHAEDQECHTEQCDLGDQVHGAGDQELNVGGHQYGAEDHVFPAECVIQLYTPDTDGPATYPTDIDGDVPPSYSKAASFDRMSVSSNEDSVDKPLMAMTTDDSRTENLDDIILPSLTHELTASELLLNKMFYDDELEGSDRFYKQQPQILQLCYALYNTLVARSEMVCYFVIILNHMISASMVTLVLPILIFLWAMLSVPRPSKRFWMTAIVYTEVAIVIKYFFQFGFFPFNQNLGVNKNKPYHPPNIIGIEKKEGYVLYDLLQLLTLFFHRSILKGHGLWDEDDFRGTENATHRDESEDKKCMSTERRGSAGSLKSVNLAVSLESVHVHFPEKQTPIRRKSSNGGSQISHRSNHSSNRSKRGSTSTRNSSRKGSSVISVQQKTRKELSIEKLKEQLIKAKAFTIKKTLEIYMPIKQFFYNLIHPEYSAVTDVYVLMFLADTVDFIIIVFGFWAFGKHSAAADITSSLSEDQVPEAFLVMVLIQFGTMVVDRALYLKKTVMGKVIFQVILVFGIHFWMFFILPGVTERRFSQNTVAQLWYFVKCIYFGLSAYQIRCGYPTRVLGNFLTKSYNYVNLFLFQGFRLVPFLTELRAVMDWVWTETTLSLSSWICVEDIYAHIFVLKCWRESEKRYPQPRGQKKKKVVKYGMGGMIIALLICIVWFPLLFMSLIKSVAGVVNKPLDVSIKITLAGYQDALQFLEAYTHEDVTIAELEGSSNSLWTISPPSRKRLIADLKKKDSDFSLSISWTIQSTISNAFPCYIRAPSDSNAKPIKQLYTDGNYQNIYLRLERNIYSINQTQEWWIVHDEENKKGLKLYVFSDQVSPPSLGFLAGYGIMGLYASVVLVIGKFVREFFSGISHSIMFEELPNVDRILKLCTDIFLVRETGELELEEDMYSKLIFLYRSPETMIKWTREKTK
ncbi:Piezo-type mechanosensitive ion channel component 2 [Acipenser ruthenus]|uniref:Piezo-type mechanosensitive ion channel component 2 n=1 Tax=Acipenser ruthenus TaxID=7906 RepID=A0A444U3K1_ACIRT|nr:Piezo-type mechanosensitive ion channel component 2 [Acipenser ruthenus]